MKNKLSGRFWCALTIKKEPIRLLPLKTPYEEEPAEIPFAEYPRPQFKRDSYLCLNGEWELAVDDTPLGTIRVPFPPESRISGIERALGKTERWIYTRKFTLPDGFRKEHTLLHFGAADQNADVYLNGVLLGRHEGGYLPFSFEITDALQAENILRVEITDPLDSELPYGKQRVKRGGMWYTPVSGLWQTVWLESLPEHYIENLRITPTLQEVTLEVSGGEAQKTLLFEGKEYPFTGNTFKLKIEEPRLWSPEDPHLYSFSLISGEDRIESYFALRTFTVEENKGKAYLCLNGKPYFCHGLLDQGYYADGIFLPAAEEGFRQDILQMKDCGFNMLRKHIKMEPDLFYYYCDKYGMLVFQDMINSGRYDFIIDTALPTLFLRRGITHRVSKRRREAFFRTAEGMLDALYNHPSVVYYTIFNEGWGQFEADACYTRFKAYDPTRVYDTTSGWFKEKLSDVESDHIYFKPVKLKPAAGKPMVLSEFGGYSCKVPEHFSNPAKNTGYHFFTQDPKAFEEELIRLYERDILSNIPQGLNAAVLTQLSDVEDETNGLLTYDRQILKVTPAKMQALADRLLKAFEEQL